MVWNKGKKYPAPWLEPYRFGNRPKAIHNRKEKYTEEERKRIWGASRRGKKMPEVTRKALDLVLRGNKFNLGRKINQETKNKMSKSHKKIMTDDFIKKCLVRRNKSSLEEKFENIIKKNNLPYVFVGNGEFIIGRKNPDFVNTNGKKIAIEVYYTRHKDQFRGGIEKWKKDRTMIFSKYGWELLYFNEKMVNENDVMKVIG